MVEYFIIGQMVFVGRDLIESLYNEHGFIYIFPVSPQWEVDLLTPSCNFQSKVICE